MGMASDSGQVYEPTYRQRDVDDKLEDHEHRISRLEKAAYIGAGYITARAPDIIDTLSGFIL